MVEDTSTGAIKEIETISSGGNGPAFATPLKGADGTANQAAVLNVSLSRDRYISVQLTMLRDFI